MSPLVFCFVFLDCERVSQSPGWSPTGYAMEDDFELLTLLLQLSKYWNFRHFLWCLVKTLVFPEN